MIAIRHAADRGVSHYDWLDSRHSFSFGGYRDAKWTGFSALRVLNEDRVDAGGGFPTHSHRDMEIISYVLDGALKHRDSTGGSLTLMPGELQLMSAGAGIAHSEENASLVDPVHFLQIWIVPDRIGNVPGYQQKALDGAALRAGFTTVAAPAGESAPFVIQQDARLAIAWSAAGQHHRLTLNPRRSYYLHVARGEVMAERYALAGGDALMLIEESGLDVRVHADSELLLFDLPGSVQRP